MIDVSGGWHDAGDYSRYVVATSKTVADLLLAYKANSSAFGDDTNIPESGNGIPDILDEVKGQLLWLLKMQNKENGGVYHKVTCANFPGHVKPEEETGELIVCPETTTATIVLVKMQMECPLLLDMVLHLHKIHIIDYQW